MYRYVFFNLLKADYSDLDSLEFSQYSDYCVWNEEIEICENLDDQKFSSFLNKPKSYVAEHSWFCPYEKSIC